MKAFWLAFTDEFEPVAVVIGFVFSAAIAVFPFVLIALLAE